LIQQVPGSEASPFDRLSDFARMIIAVSEDELKLENTIKKSGSAKRGPFSKNEGGKCQR